MIFASAEYSDKIQKQVSHPSLKTHVYESALEKEKKDDGDKHWLVEMMQHYGDTWSADSVKYVHESAPIFNMMFESLTAAYDDLTKIVNEVKPSIIIYDQLFATPVGQDQGIPWANFFSCAINFVGLKGMPPPQSGLPTEWNAQNEKQWEGGSILSMNTTCPNNLIVQKQRLLTTHLSLNRLH